MVSVRFAQVVHLVTQVPPLVQQPPEPAPILLDALDEARIANRHRTGSSPERCTRAASNHRVSSRGSGMTNAWRRLNTVLVSADPFRGTRTPV